MNNFHGGRTYKTYLDQKTTTITVKNIEGFETIIIGCCDEEPEKTFKLNEKTYDLVSYENGSAKYKLRRPA